MLLFVLEAQDSRKTDTLHSEEEKSIIEEKMLRPQSTQSGSVERENVASRIAAFNQQENVPKPAVEPRSKFFNRTDRE